MSLYLVRHGQTDWNLAKRFQASTDVPLNTTGREQAQQIEVALSKRALTFKAASTSPLERARETATIILQQCDLEAGIDNDLIELSVGDFEGQPESELQATMGQAFDDWRAGCFTRAAPNGETVFEAMVRAERVLASLIAGRHDDDFLIVGHQGINMAIMASLSRRTDIDSLTDFKQANDQVEVWDTRSGKRLERFSVG